MSLHLASKIFFTVLVLCILSSCSSGSGSGGSTGTVSANSANGQALLGAVGDMKNMSGFLNYLEDNSDSGGLTLEQQQMLNNCLYTSSMTLDDPPSQIFYDVSGANCPISYSANTTNSQNGNSASISMTLSYRLKNPAFHPNAKVTSADCTVDAQMTKISETEFSMSGDISCSFMTTASGSVNLQMTMSLQNSSDSMNLSLNGNINGGGKVITLAVTTATNKNSGQTTSNILINGQISTDDHGLLELSNLFN